MSITDVIKAWKDEDFRAQLVGQGVTLPESPVGMISLEETELEGVGGGYPPTAYIFHTCDGGLTCGTESYCVKTCPASAGGRCS